MAHLCHGKSLDAAGVGNMGTETQVDEGSAAVYGGRGAIGDLVVDVVLLVLVVLHVSVCHDSRTEDWMEQDPCPFLRISSRAKQVYSP